MGKKHVMTVREAPGESNGFRAIPDNGAAMGASRMFGKKVSGARIDLANRVMLATDVATGRVVRLDLGPADVHVDTILPAFAAGFKLADSHADSISGVVVTPKQSNKFPIWDADNALQQVDNFTSGPGGHLPEVSVTLSKYNYAAIEYVLATFMPTEVEANADGALRPGYAAVRRIMNAMRLGRENRVITQAFAAASWSTANKLALTSGANWNGGVSSDPVGNLFTLMENSVLPITSLAMNERVYNRFITNAQVQKYIQFKQGVPGLPNPDQIGDTNALLRLPKNIYISKMKTKTSTGYDYLWPDSVLLFREVDGAITNGEDTSSFKTFRWLGGDDMVKDKVQPFQDGQGGTGFGYNGVLYRQYWDQRRGGRGGMMSIIVMNDAEVLTGLVGPTSSTNSVGGLITGIIQ